MSPTGPSPLPWGDFTQDPRGTESSPLRASDRDRDVVLEVLAQGYAEGRLTRDEYDERATRTASARTLGELPALIDDLVPDRARRVPEDLHAQAVTHWESQRRQALVGMLLPTLICWTVWVMTGLTRSGGFDPGFAWPVFVMLGTGAHLARVLLGRQDIVAEEQQRLERKQLQALERRRDVE